MKTTLAPFLSVRNGIRAIDFYRAAFGAVVKMRLDGEGESVVAWLAIEDAEFWVADESPEHFNFSPDSLGGGSVRMVLNTQTPDEAFDRAVAAGAKVIVPVRDEDYGWRVGRLVDPFGHHWEIGKPLD